MHQRLMSETGDVGPNMVLNLVAETEYDKN